MKVFEVIFYNIEDGDLSISTNLFTNKKEALKYVSSLLKNQKNIFNIDESDDDFIDELKKIGWVATINYDSFELFEDGYASQNSVGASIKEKEIQVE